MKMISNMSDYAEFGINPLTGEADKYGKRLLCDLNEDGVELVRTWFGLPVPIDTARKTFAESWNSRVGEKPSVGSVMLSRPALSEIIVFALVRGGEFDHVYNDNGRLYALTQDEYMKYAENGLHFGEGWTRALRDRTGSDRNTHQMTGRTL